MLWVALHVDSDTGRERFCVLKETMGSSGERELANFATRAEAHAFIMGCKMYSA